MTRPTTPYTKYLGDRDPLSTIRESIAAVTRTLDGWPAERYEQSYAPGKWNARQILTHLAQTEMALGTRARMAVATPQYAAQSWDQDLWMALERLSASEARDGFLAMARMNLAFFAGLTTEQRAIALSHPEYGSLTVDWIIHQMAGHHINHLQQLQQIR